MVKHSPGNHKGVGPNPTTGTVKNEKNDIGIAPCTEGAPIVRQDLSGRPVM